MSIYPPTFQPHPGTEAGEVSAFTNLKLLTLFHFTPSWNGECSLTIRLLLLLHWVANFGFIFCELRAVSVSTQVNEGGDGKASELEDRAATQALNCCSARQWCGRADVATVDKQIRVPPSEKGPAGLAVHTSRALPLDSLFLLFLSLFLFSPFLSLLLLHYPSSSFSSSFSLAPPTHLSSPPPFSPAFNKHSSSLFYLEPLLT